MLAILQMRKMEAQGLLLMITQPASGAQMLTPKSVLLTPAWHCLRRSPTSGPRTIGGP